MAKKKPNNQVKCSVCDGRGYPSDTPKFALGDVAHDLLYGKVQITGIWWDERGFGYEYVLLEDCNRPYTHGIKTGDKGSRMEVNDRGQSLIWTLGEEELRRHKGAQR